MIVSTEVQPQRLSVRPDTSRRWSYAVALVTLGLALGASCTPSPIYPLYAQQWHVSPLATTAIFAAYAAGALCSVLTVGPISDVVGRKPLLLAGLAVLVVGFAVFAMASTVWELMAARFLHGLAVGTILVVASAALLDLRPEQGSRNGIFAGVALNTGGAVVTLASAAVAQWLPAPLRLPYAVMMVVALAVLLLALRWPEPHPAALGIAIRLRRPTVPSTIRRDFLFAGTGIAVGWAVLAFYMSLYPTMARAAGGHLGTLTAGAVIAVLSAFAALAQAFAGKIRPHTAAVTGDIAMAVLLVLAIPVTASSNVALMIAHSALFGVAYGLSFGGSLRHLNSVAPPNARGGVMGAYYLLGYVSQTVVTLGAGWLSNQFGTAAVFPWFAGSCAFVAAVIGIVG